MTHTQQIIQDAIEGGWHNPEADYTIYHHFLDPLFWQAVGKTRGWGLEKAYESDVGVHVELNTKVPKQKCSQFINHLWEGVDYETALSKLV